MTTPRDDIAGLSERLRRSWIGNDGYLVEPSRREIEAATALDALQARVGVSMVELDGAVERSKMLLEAKNYWMARATRAQQERDEAYERLKAIIDAKALSGVRYLVAGWNGENRPEGPFKERHPDRLGATLPKTNCGAVYQLDEAMTAARDLVSRLAAGTEKEGK